MVRSSGSWRVVTRPGEARSGQSDYSAIATATSAGGTGCFSSSVMPLATALRGQVIPNGRTSCSYPDPYPLAPAFQGYGWTPWDAMHARISVPSVLGRRSVAAWPSPGGRAAGVAGPVGP